jgi:hypothetical protein
MVDRLLYSLSTPIDFFSFKTPTLSDQSFLYLSSSSETKLPEGGNKHSRNMIYTETQRRGEERNIGV